jgi:hypothetical protein
MRRKRRDSFLITDRVTGQKRHCVPEEAAIIKGQLARGDLQQDITAYWGTNSGRVAEINRGQRYAWLEPAPPSALPPPGAPIVAATAATIQVTGVATKFWESLQRVEEKQDQMLRQLAAFGRSHGFIENPRTPRIGRRRPLEG